MVELINYLGRRVKLSESEACAFGLVSLHASKVRGHLCRFSTTTAPQQCYTVRHLVPLMCFSLLTLLQTLCGADRCRRRVGNHSGRIGKRERNEEGAPRAGSDNLSGARGPVKVPRRVESE